MRLTILAGFLLAGIALAALSSNVQVAPPGPSCCRPASTLPNIALIAGGQNGTWFKPDQDPRLFKIDLADEESYRLPAFQSQGTIWSGSTNGTNWLISGWGNDQYGANPPIVIYDTLFRIVYSSSDPNVSSSWYGGDIFASSYGDHGWLLSGLGSGYLSGMGGNHMSLALFDGSNFIDLSSMIPNNQLGILYANEWNGSLWMVGGGFRRNGLLFTFNGTTIHDLTNQLAGSVPSLGPVTSLGWNGTDWLIGRYQSLALYNGHKFFDLTKLLVSAIGNQFQAVNAISWDKQDGVWLLAGGSPKADVRLANAWLASLSSTGNARNLSSLISPYLGLVGSSSILTASFDDGLWALGGYKTNGSKITPILLLISVPAGTVTDLSRAVDDMTYVIWIQLSRPPYAEFQPNCEAEASPSPRPCADHEALRYEFVSQQSWFKDDSVATMVASVSRNVSSCLKDCREWIPQFLRRCTSYPLMRERARRSMLLLCSRILRTEYAHHPFPYGTY